MIIKPATDASAPADGSVLYTRSPDGDLMWFDGTGRSREIRSMNATGSVYDLPDSVNTTLADIKSPQTFTNKTLRAAGDNVIEPTILLGRELDVTAPTDDGATLKYDGVTTKWALAAPMSAASPLSFAPATSQMSVAVGTSAGTVCSGNDPRFSSKNVLIVKATDAGANEYTSVAAAVNAVTAAGDSSETNQYVIKISPGVYVEPLIVMPNFTALKGEEIYSVIIKPDSPDHNIINMGYGNELSFLSLSGASGVGCAGVFYTGLDMDGTGYDDGWMQVHKVQIDDCYYCVHVESAAHCEVYMEYAEFYGPYVSAVHQDGTARDPMGAPWPNFISLENSYITAEDNNERVADISSTGGGAFLRMSVIGIINVARQDGNSDVPLIDLSTNARAQIQCAYLTTSGAANGDTSGVGLRIASGSSATTSAVLMFYLDRGVVIPDGGTAPNVYLDVLTATCDIECVRVDHPNARGIIWGNGVLAKCYVNPSSRLALNLLDSSTDTPSYNTGLLYVGVDIAHKLELSEYCGTLSVGLTSGGRISVTSGTTIAVASGTGYVAPEGQTYVIKVAFAEQSIALADNSAYNVYIDDAGVLHADISAPVCSCATITLGYVITGTAEVIDILQLPSGFDPRQSTSKMCQNFRRVFGALVVSGLAIGTTPTTVTIGSGEYIWGFATYTPSGATITTTGFRQASHAADNIAWTYASTTTIASSQYNPAGSGLIALPAGEYTRHSIFMSGSGSSEIYFVVIGQDKVTTLLECDNLRNSILPSWFGAGAVHVADIAVQNGAGIAKTYDMRPVPNFSGSNASASAPVVAYHSGLLGLTADDHLQYLRTDGTRALTGALNLGTHAITGATTVNGVTVEAHAARHGPTGADPLPIAGTYGSTTLTAGTVNYRGDATTFALSDHAHSVDISTFSVANMIGTLGVAHGGTGLTSLTPSRFLTSNASGAIVTTLAAPAGTIVGTTDTQVLTNKTLDSTTNAVTANALRANTVYANTASTVKVNTLIGPSPRDRYTVLASLAAPAAGLVNAAWGSMYELMPTWKVTQNTNLSNVLTAATWITRRFNAIHIDSSLLNFDPAPLGAAEYPWNCYNRVTLINAGAATAAARLLPGLYEFDCWAVGNRCGNHKIRLFNRTTGLAVSGPGTDPCEGSLEYAPTLSSSDYPMSRSTLRCFVSLAATSDIELQHYAYVSYGQGQGSVRNTGDAGMVAAFGTSIIAMMRIRLMRL